MKVFAKSGYNAVLADQDIHFFDFVFFFYKKQK